MRTLSILTATTTMLIALSAAQAADPHGVWATEGGKAQVRMADCGGALCGTIIALSEPNDTKTGRPKSDENNPDPGKRSRPMIGTQIVLGMKPDSANKWSGNIYNAEDGKTYSGSFTLISTTSAQLQGCVLGGLICKGQTWTRVK